jgi:hypothetical protein
MVYLILFVTDSENDDFSIAGGSVGALSSIIVIYSIAFYQGFSSSSTLLFWRAVCDLGFAVRFITIPAWNLFLGCSGDSCSRTSASKYLNAL